MYRSSKIFNGKPVVGVFDDTQAFDLTTIAPQMRIDPESEQSFKTHLDEFIRQYDVSSLDTLVVGGWLQDYEPYDETKPIFDLLLKKQGDFPSLKALFVGDIAQEESEISWIEISELSPFLMQFPALEYFRVRGAGDFLSTPLQHQSLRKLAFETGGLSSETVQQLLQSTLPNLESLELWIGDESYGDAGFDDIKALIEVLPTRYPKLQSLGLRNSEFVDDIAQLLGNTALPAGLAVLDLSLGTLTDKGAQTLLDSTGLSQITELDLHYHFVKDNTLLSQLQGKFPKVNVSDKQQGSIYNGEVERYVFVGE